MSTKNEIKNVRNLIICTVFVAVLLSSVFLLAMNFIYKDAENDCFDMLHIETAEIKNDINIQINSDRENLTTMASFAASLYENGKGYGVLLDSFEAIGLISSIGILTNENMIVTAVGQVAAPAGLSFSDEAARGSYISGRIPDVTKEGREIIRMAVPVVSRGVTVAMLYGIIDLERFEARYIASAEANEAQLFVVEGGNGNFLLDTKHNQIENISEFSGREYKSKYSYAAIIADIAEEKSGYSSFVSKFTGETLYIHYSPLGIADWYIMLAEPEANVFSEARVTGAYLFLIFGIVIVIMAAYLVLMFASERTDANINAYAAKIRKLLIGINQRYHRIEESLYHISQFSKSRSAFFVDTDGEDYNYISPEYRSKLLSGEERRYFVTELLNYHGRSYTEQNVSMSAVKMIANGLMKKAAPQLYDFFVKHKIKNIAFTLVANKSGHKSVIGVVNPVRLGSAAALLEEIAVCFSMAIFNKKYLSKTETVAATDSLTGLYNRMAYKRALVKHDEEMPESFSCIYIDVNELHTINNKHGHAAGDGLLIYIASVLKEVFAGYDVYRLGGDEFLVFVDKLSEEQVNALIDSLHAKVAEKNAHISVGMAHCTRNIDTDSLVTEAEKRMYQAKAEYYQIKEKENMPDAGIQVVEHIATGVPEIDAVFSVMSHRYLGIYCVKLNSDETRPIFMPYYLKKYSEEDNHFSRIFIHYVQDLVNPDYQRPMFNFLKYDVIKKQLLSGNTPSITYEKINGGKFRLSVYALAGDDKDITDTIWVFEREN